MKNIVFLIVLLIASPAYSATYYVCGSAASCNSGNGSPSGWSTGSSGNNGLSKATPKQTIAQGIAELTAGNGDTLIIGNGTYINQPINNVPSGTAPSTFTTVKAENVGGAIIDVSAAAAWTSALTTDPGDHHIHFDGFKLIGNRTVFSNGVVYSQGSYNKLTRLAVTGGGQSGNQSAFALGTGAQNNLVEECWVWGTSRYMFIIYNEGSGAETRNNVLRRNVARHDYSIDDEDQESCFTNYDSTNTLFQNNICVDANGTTALYGGFWDENNAVRDKSGRMYGNIVLNLTGNVLAGMHDKPSGTRVLEDNIIWNAQGGWGTADYLGSSGTYPATVTFNRMTIGGLTGNYTGGWPIAQGVGAKWGVSTRVPTITNSIITGAHNYGIAEWFTNDYIALYNNSANYGGNDHTPTAGAHNITNVNPLTNCLKYLPRIESANCSLKTAGSTGGQIGAEILYKHGKPGTLYGETGYDTLTSEPLWPFPNEAQIKADFASYSGPGPAGARGFATGTSIDGSAQTLTKYIWEYLGNQIPADIYGGSTVSMGTVLLGK